MQQNTDKTWRCSICGYLHYGDVPPERCPICDAKVDDFKEIVVAIRPERHEVGRERVVVIGAGIAGVSAVTALRENAPDAEIVLISKEDVYPYHRLNLTRWLAGEITEDTLPLHNPGWYEDLNIDFRRGVSVEEIVMAEKKVRLEDQQTIPYDKLIVTAGAHPLVPAIPGTHIKGVFTVHTISDVHAILDSVQSGTQVVCIGGGILGLEAAGALVKRKADVTAIEAFDYLMPRQVNAEGSRVIERHLETLGIKMMVNAHVDCILGDDQVTGVHLKCGQSIPATVVVLAVGDRPNTELLEKAGLTVKTGVLVDNFMRTSNPDIFAAGDVCEHDGILYGAWTPAMYQGKIAGRNAAGVPTEFGGIPRSHLLKVLGKPMFSIGTITAADGSYHIIEDHADDGYRMFMFRDGRIVGCLLIGKLKLLKQVRKAVQARINMEELLVNNPSAEDIGKYLASL